jgi:hypothetical protein
MIPTTPSSDAGLRGNSSDQSVSWHRSGNSGETYQLEGTYALFPEGFNLHSVADWKTHTGPTVMLRLIDGRRVLHGDAPIPAA